MSYLENIRNFCIIAHIDHGKSTLADRLLEATNTIEQRHMKEQFLDSMDLEKERGITIKLKPVRMEYHVDDILYVLNIIDTPGHVDFSYEVSRSLAACEGAIVLVDATQGVQAQTIANVDKALAQGLKVIPVVNKIDMSTANVEDTALEMTRLFGFSQKDIVLISAKTGEGIKELLQKIIRDIPPPKTPTAMGGFKALIFDSSFNEHLGVISSIRVFSGEISTNSKIKLLKTGQASSAIALGYMKPEFTPCDKLVAGEVGVVATGLKDIKKVRVGDTMASVGQDVDPLPGYKEPKPVVFLGIYPKDASRYLDLRRALDRLGLNDSSLIFEPESGGSLGHGFKCGFLGLLHAEIIQERIEREYNLEIISTTPTVAYKIHLTNGQVLYVSSASSFPNLSHISFAEEPQVEISIYCPSNYIGDILDLCSKRRGKLVENIFVKGEISERVKIKFLMPLSEMITDFYDKLKSVSSGYASLDYEITDYKRADVVKLTILVAGLPVDALSRVVFREKAPELGRKVVAILKDTLPKEQFPVALQAAIGGTIIARETIPAMRKTVTQKLYGGDVTRKNKLLDRQKEGKSRLKEMGRGKVQITKEAFWKVVKIG
jgi:GTP-binding protein LepA